MIGSRLEADASAAACRLAFYGRLVALVDAPERPGALARLRLLKLKARTGSVERVAPDGGSAVCKGMFKRDTDISRFVGLKARLPGSRRVRWWVRVWLRRCGLEKRSGGVERGAAACCCADHNASLGARWCGVHCRLRAHADAWGLKSSRLGAAACAVAPGVRALVDFDAPVGRGCMRKGGHAAGL